jgi:phage protein U
MAGYMRTNVLRAALLAFLLVLAGCNGGGGGATTTDQQQTLVSNPSTVTDGSNPTTATPTPATGSPRGLEPRTAQGQRFLELAEANDVPVRTAVTINGTFSVVYEVEPGADGSVSRRGFRLAQLYATVVNETWASNESSWNATRMEATAITEDDVLVSSYRMPAYWGRQVRSTEIFTESWLGRQLDDANSRIYQNGTVANVSRNLSRFGATLQANTNGTVEGVTRRGGTVFVTFETETDNRTVRRNRVGTIVRVYGALAYRGWDPERMEVEVVRPDGDTYGWYHIERIRALNSYRNQATAPIQLALDTLYLEADGLDGPRDG